MELLNGKALDMFWEWFFKPETLKRHKLDTMLKFSNEASVKVHVYSFPKICQNALIIEWLDSVNIAIIIRPKNIKSWDYEVHDFKNIDYVFDCEFESRQEATVEAIKKEVELINESNGK